MENNYYFLKNIYTNEISYYTEETFKLEFGDKRMDKRKLIKYITITFAITGICWWGLALLTNYNIVDSSQGIFTLVHVIGGFGPTIAAIMVLPPLINANRIAGETSSVDKVAS